MYVCIVNAQKTFLQCQALRGSLLKSRKHHSK